MNAAHKNLAGAQVCISVAVIRASGLKVGFLAVVDPEGAREVCSNPLPVTHF